MKLTLSGSQTVGPYFSIGMNSLCSKAVPVASDGEMLLVEGALLDGEGQPIPDALLELWQADAEGKYSETTAISSAETFGFARISTQPDGTFSFTTAKPGPVSYDGHRMQAPHIVVLVYMRGLLRHLVTRMYFPAEQANDSDPVLSLVPAERRGTLIARYGDAAGILRWNIVMRAGAENYGDETVFFAW